MESIFLSRVEGRGFHVEGNFSFNFFFYKKMESIFLSRVEGRGSRVEGRGSRVPCQGEIFFNFFFIKKCVVVV